MNITYNNTIYNNTIKFISYFPRGKADSLRVLQWFTLKNTLKADLCNSQNQS